MEWGFPHQVPGKRPGVMLDTFVTNARHLHYPLWRDTFADPVHRCLVPFTHFAEPHPERGKGDDGLPKQAWFCLPNQPVGVFAGLWTETPRGRAYAFATCQPNEIVAPIHPKAMPAILLPSEWERGWRVTPKRRRRSSDPTRDRWTCRSRPRGFLTAALSISCYKVTAPALRLGPDGAAQRVAAI
ncbi:SOS response-associated peptidase family protein [Novosphingobium sp. JCM 18896]|uniref:SOS response-associated peptidase family protein n=1 Tax=Novosphingobium sp. JCM 18896 TaxID=2989731 RepID=UPI002221FDCB|nr:SOS response-associated peptidase family protein [Novosphingobium sp. JCM 18896]MCW1432107.1 SOS response-associated peptidase family protein [Novosphingobium sp. JCM 18896]